MPLNRIGHSVGFVVVATNAQGDDWSWRVGESGDVVELGGWGFSATAPPVDRNPPADLRAVHTVAVTAIDDRVFAGLRQLVDAHQDRYGECSVWTTAGADRKLVRWIAAGCPAIGGAPSEEELAARARTEVKTADDAQFKTAEPRLGADGKPAETSKEDIPDPLEEEKRIVAAARKEDAKQRAKAKAAQRQRERRARLKAEKTETQGAGETDGDPA
ncbi:MAG: hypothetical protein ACRDZV_16235 [Acidimicrobiia bacterium]